MSGVEDTSGAAPGTGSPSVWQHPDPVPAQPYPPYGSSPYAPQPPAYGSPSPYAPPPPAYGSPGWGAPGWGPRLQDNTGLGIAMLVLGGLVVLGDVLQAATSFSAVDAYDAAAASGQDPALVFTPYDALGVFGVVGLPLWIVGSLWLMRAHRNAEILDPPGVRRSIAWSWLGWVVPIVSLWFPKQIVDDAWRITTTVPGNAGSPTTRRPTATWWGLWIAYQVLSNVVERLQLAQLFGPATSTGAADVHQGVVPGLLVAVAIVGAAAYLAWIPVVLGLSRAQASLAGRR